MLKNSLNNSAIEQLDKHGLTPDTHKVALACALLWTARTQTDVHRLLGLSGLTTSTGRAFTFNDVKSAVEELKDKKLLVAAARPTAFQLVDALRAPLYRQLLETRPGKCLPGLVAELDRFDPTRSSYYWPSSSLPTTIAYVRAKFFSGTASEELSAIRQLVARSMDWERHPHSGPPARLRWPQFRVHRSGRTLAARLPGRGIDMLELGAGFQPDRGVGP
jgi:hypothetical protein